jgi:hypothetical protein
MVSSGAAQNGSRAKGAMGEDQGNEEIAWEF